MLEPDQWQEALSKLHGTVLHGTERLPSRVILDALQVGNSKADRQKAGKQVTPLLRALGFHGPEPMRFADGSEGSGYWRAPHQMPPQDGNDASVLSDALPAALEELTRESIKKLHRIVRLPLDPHNAGLLRAQVTSALGAIQCQLRADEARLRTKATGDVLQRLERLIAEQKKLIPKQHLAISLPAETSEPQEEVAAGAGLEPRSEA